MDFADTLEMVNDVALNRRVTMIAANETIELEPALLAKLDDFVKAHVFRSRNDAVTAAVREKIERLESQRQFLIECQKLDPAEEQAFAEEWFEGERTAWTAS